LSESPYFHHSFDRKFMDMDKQIFTNLSAEELAQTIKDSIRDVLDNKHANDAKNDSEEDLLTIEDVQKIFRVSKVTIHKWKKLGLIPYYKVNRKLYFKKSEVMDSLQNKKRKLEIRR